MNKILVSKDKIISDSDNVIINETGNGALIYTVEGLQEDVYIFGRGLTKTIPSEVENEEGKEDFVSVMDDESGQIVSIGLHFTKDDFTVENIYKQLNAVARNFIGIEIPKEKTKSL